MPQVDGSIRVGTKIDVKEAERELKSLEGSIEKTAGKIDSLRSKMDALKDVKIPTEQYKEYEKILLGAENKLTSLYKEQEKFLSGGGKKSAPTFQEMLAESEQLERKIAGITKAMDLIERRGEAFTLGADTDEYAEMAAQVQQLNQQMESDTQRQSELQSQLAAEEQRLADIKANATISDHEIINLLEHRRELIAQIKDMEAASVGLGYQEYESANAELAGIDAKIKEYKNSLSDVPQRFSAMRTSAQKAFSAIRSGFSVIGKAGKNIFGSLTRAAKNAFGSIRSGAKKSGGILSTFASRLKGIALSLLIFNWISKGFNAMVSGMKKGFENFAGYSDSYAQSVQNMKNAMSTLGNQIAAAFAPIAQMAIPWINSLISALSSAMTYVAQFIAALTGKSTFTKAVQIQDKYNKSLGGTAKAADKARGALAKFDDLDVLQKKEDASGGGGGAMLPEDMFEEVPVSDKFKNIVDWLKDMWENSDFYELGKLLGEKLKEALDNIPWDEIKEKARKIGKSIASFINGFIEVEGLGYSIGRTLAEAFNTGFEFLNAFVHELHWDSLGKFIAETLNGIFENIDWELIHDTFVTGAKGLGDAINSFVDYLNWDAIATAISNLVNTFVDTFYEFFTTVDWGELGEKVGKTISDAWTGIDWKKAGETVGEAFKGFFDFISETIENIDWHMVGQTVLDFLLGVDWLGIFESLIKGIGAILGGALALADVIALALGDLIRSGMEGAKEHFQTAIEEAGGNIVEGIFNGIIEAMGSIGQWIYEHIFLPFTEGFRNAFGIHSPSTVMQEMGGYLIEGLLLGIQETWTLLTEWFSTIFEELSLFFEEKWTAIKEGAMEIWNGLKESLSETWENIRVGASEKFEAVKKVFEDVWARIKTVIDEKVKNIKEKIQELLLKFSNFKDDSKKAFDNVKESVVNALNPVIEKLQDFVQWVKDAISAVQDFFSSGYEKVGTSAGKTSKGGGGYSAAAYSASSTAYRSVMADIPKLASGSVIRGGNPFMAMLGDQPRSQTNVEAPLSTIEQAVDNVMSRRGNEGYGNTTISLNVNGEEFARLTLGDFLSEMQRRGYDVDVLGVT